jgi:hypothetical protein
MLRQELGLCGSGSDLRPPCAALGACPAGASDDDGTSADLKGRERRGSENMVDHKSWSRPRVTAILIVTAILTVIVRTLVATLAFTGVLAFALVTVLGRLAASRTGRGSRWVLFG